MQLPVKQAAAMLLAEPGVGVISAAQILCAWSHPGRLRSEAAFAALAGVAPIPASSGQVCRHRLNRAGDRQLNRALHTVVISRLRRDPETWSKMLAQWVPSMKTLASPVTCRS
jgi:transposase